MNRSAASTRSTFSERFAFRVLTVMWLAMWMAPEIRAFEVIGLTWPTSRASYFINPNFPTLAGSPAEQIEVLRCAADSWRNQSAANFRFDYAGQTGDTTAIVDGRNLVFYSPEDDNEALAITLISGFGNRFTEFDMIFFGSTDDDPNVWQNFGEPVSNNLDLRGTAVHEFGHALGLEHTPVQAATMFFAIQNQGLTLRTLHQDDRDGVESLYGQRAGANTAPIVQSFGHFVGSAFGGDTLTFDGTNFTWPSDTVIEIGGSSVTGSQIDEHSCSTMVVPSTPAGDPGLVDIVIRNELGETVLEDAFEYRINPELTSVEPNRGPVSGGIDVRVHGENFTSTGTVFIAGSPLVNPRFVSSTTVEGTLPASAFSGSVNVQYVVGGENASILGGFTYFDVVLQVVDTDVVVDPGSPVDHFVNFSLDSDENLRAFEFELGYDATMLEVTSLSTVGTLSESAAIQDLTVDAENGELLVRIDTSGGSPIAAASGETLVRLVVRAGPGVSPGEVVPITFIPDELFVTTDAGGGTGEGFGVGGAVKLTFPPNFLRGDVTGDDALSIEDPMILLFHLFGVGFVLLCGAAADFDDSGALDTTDAVLSLLFQFAGGTPPATPYPAVGPDPTADSLGCSP